MENIENRSEELAKLLNIKPKYITKEIGNVLGFCNTTIKYVYPNFTKQDNFNKLKYVFKEWSTPFSFIEDGEFKDFYWAHRSINNYIEFLSFSLPKVMPSCLARAAQKAQKINWTY